jgi:hypothetical protein
MRLKQLILTNTPAYYSAEFNTDVKGFIVSGPTIAIYVMQVFSFMWGSLYSSVLQCLFDQGSLAEGKGSVQLTSLH